MQSIFTIEDHSLIGGLGETVAMHICQNIGQNLNKNIIFKPFGLPDCYFHEIGSRDYLRNKSGLSTEAISNEILKVLKLNLGAVNAVSQSLSCDK